MFARPLWILVALWGTVVGAIAAPAKAVPVEQRRWFETRTDHFNIYSCGDVREVYKLAGRLEQFCKGYALLAGTRAVDSPPIIVIAFPDHETMQPFLPLYQGKPVNLAAFFQHGTDENLIVLSLAEAGATDNGMEVIFHEYTHLLFRRNDQIWPIWLKEGMAEVYSTFQTLGPNVRIAIPIAGHLQTLRAQPLMPLDELFSVQHDSPQYNERDRQGLFYAESWLLTHFLMAGDYGQYRARLGQYTGLLRQGQTPVQAFTNAMHATLPAVETALQRYLDHGVFTPVDLTLKADISAPISLTARYLTPVEIYFRLGDELLRIHRLDAAEAQFTQAQKIAPASPLPEDGLGLLANQRDQHSEALSHFQSAIRLGSTSYLTYYLCALEELRATADAQDRYTQLPKAQAAEIRSHFERSLALMPDFGPAQELFGFFEMVQGEQLAAAGQHLQRAMQLEPENQTYLLTLAQYQYKTRDPAAARQTLAQLLQPYVNPKLRDAAHKLLEEIDRQSSAKK